MRSTSTYVKQLTQIFGLLLSTIQIKPLKQLTFNTTVNITTINATTSPNTTFTSTITTNSTTTHTTSTLQPKLLSLRGDNDPEPSRGVPRGDAAVERKSSNPAQYTQPTLLEAHNPPFRRPELPTPPCISGYFS